jgi:hypothetical protein
MSLRRTTILDDPLTFDDEIDKANVSLGFAMAIPYLLMRSYADIFGSTWIWGGFSEREISGAVKLVHALGNSDMERVNVCVEILGSVSAIRVVRALVKMDIISIIGRHLLLMLKGREILSQ